MDSPAGGARPSTRGSAAHARTMEPWPETESMSRCSVRWRSPPPLCSPVRARAARWIRGGIPESATTLARPEPDPTCRGTVQDRLLVEGIEQIRVSVDVDRSGKLELVQFLTPDLTPAQMVELRSALEGCAWRPGVGADGEPVAASSVLVFGPVTRP